jgi:hypothetical protein
VNKEQLGGEDRENPEQIEPDKDKEDDNNNNPDLGPFATIVVNSFIPWLVDDDNDMPSILKEFQDIPKLEALGKNWKIFKSHVELAAEAMSIEDHLSSKVTEPTDATEKKEWKATRAQLRNAVTQKLPDIVLTKHIGEGTPCKLWAALKKEFGTVNIVHVTQIEAAMASAKCSDGGNIHNYFTTMIGYKMQLDKAGGDAKLSDKHFHDAIIVGAHSAGPAYISVIESLVTSYTAARKEADLKSELFMSHLQDAYNAQQALQSTSKCTDSSASANFTHSNRAGHGNSSRGNRSCGQGRSHGGRSSNENTHNNGQRGGSEDC